MLWLTIHIQNFIGIALCVGRFFVWTGDLVSGIVYPFGGVEPTRPHNTCLDPSIFLGFTLRIYSCICIVTVTSCDVDPVAVHAPV